MRCVPTLLLLLVCVCGAQKDQPAPIIPLAKGTTWVYQAHLKYTVANTSPVIVREKDVRWRMEVMETVSGKGFRAAFIKGAPWDLPWYEPGVTDRGDYLFVTVGDTTYQLQDKEALETYRTLKISGVTQEVRKMLSEGHVWFRTPLRDSATYCEAGQPAQLGGMYCWHVDEVKKIDLARIAGLDGTIRTGYIMAYRTNPDHQILTLVPGIGITAWAYAHHGTVDEVDARLVEFHRGGKEP